MNDKDKQDLLAEQHRQLGELITAWRGLQDAERNIGRLVELEYAKLASVDPDHPLYVRPHTAAHWHVRFHADADEATMSTVFDALLHAADGLERIAEFAREGLGTARTDEEFGLLRSAYADGAIWDGLAQNARSAMEQATRLPYQRAPLFNSQDPAQDRRTLLKVAKDYVENINTDGPPGFRVRQCVDPECVLLKEDDDADA